jgi:hypothetical protein
MPAQLVSKMRNRFFLLGGNVAVRLSLQGLLIAAEPSPPPEKAEHEALPLRRATSADREIQDYKFNAGDLDCGCRYHHSCKPRCATQTSSGRRQNFGMPHRRTL